MALVAQYDQIKGFKSLCYKRVDGGHHLNPITKTLVFSTMVIFMDSITEKNWEQFYERIAAWEKVFGSMTEVRDRRFKTRWRDQYITPDDVRAHIGLTVNVMPKSDAYFYRHLVKVLRREVREALCD